ncbi:MAG: oligosaccharide flippase family protein [Pseudomonadota bacterium]
MDGPQWQSADVARMTPKDRLAALPDQLRARVAETRAALSNPSSRASRGSRSMSWSGLRVGTNVISRLAANLFTTSILMPEAFSLSAVVFMLLGGLNMISDAGIEESIVRHQRGDQTSFLHTAFVVRALRGVVLGLIVLGVAGGLAIAQGYSDFSGTVYGHPDLVFILTLAALQPVLGGLVSPVYFLGARLVELRQMVLINIAGSILGLVSMMVVVWLTEEAWALLTASFVSTAVMVTLSHRLPGPGMRFAVEREALSEFWGFGRWIIGASFFNFVSREGDRLITSAILDIETFAIFAIARIWLEAGANLLQMAQPTVRGLIAEAHRESLETQKRVVGKLQPLMLGACLVAFVSAFLVAPPVIEVLYRDAFHATGPMIAALAGVMLWRVDLIAEASIIAAGRSRLLASINLMTTVVLLAGVPLLYPPFGLEGLIAATLFARLLGHLVFALSQAALLERARTPVLMGVTVRGVLAFMALAFSGVTAAGG